MLIIYLIIYFDELVNFNMVVPCKETEQIG